MTAIARLLAALVVIAIATFETPTVAIGGTFAVTSCTDAPGDANNAWTSTVTDSVTMEAAAKCGQGAQGGLTVAERLGVGPNADAGDEAWWAFTAPSGTRIVKLDADRTGRILLDQDWRPEIRADGALLETCAFAAGTDSCGFGALGGGARRAFQGLSATAVSVGGRCVPTGAAVCSRGASMHRIEVVLYGATVTIDDQQDPSFTAQHTVAAANGSWHTANSAAVTLASASDNTGIRERRAIVDGVVQQTWAAPGAIAGGCGELNSGVAYTFTRPCAGARGLNSAMAGVLSLAGLEDGIRTVRFSAVDTGGREVLSPEYTIKLDRNPPAVAAASPGQLSAGQPLTFATAVSDGASGVASTEREMSVDGGGWEPMSGAAQAGRAYRFRIRALDVAGNRSAWVETTSVRVPAAAMPEPSPSPSGPNAGADATEGVPLLPAADAPPAAAPPTASVAIPAPQVAPTTVRADGTPRVGAARLDRTRVRVSGTLPITASGRLTVTFAAKVRGRTVRVSQRVGVSRGRWSASLPIKGALRKVTAGTLTVRYAGDGAVAPGTTARVIKRR